jgi:cytochrome oxidase assembly protein ShyY1
MLYPKKDNDRLNRANEKIWRHPTDAENERFERKIKWFALGIMAAVVIAIIVCGSVGK